jgi:hypothetical protein
MNSSDSQGSMHHVFVDYENVQEEPDLRSLGDEAIEVTILVGAKQRLPKASYLHNLLERAGDVRLIKMPASGNNALDLALACQLGMAVARDPTGTFHIFSRDKDFNRLIDHLRRADIWVDRLEARSDEPVARPPRAPAARAAEAAGGHEKRSSAGSRSRPAPSGDPVAIMEQLLYVSGPRRPKSKAKLEQVIRNRFGDQPSDAELAKIMDGLARQGTIAIDPKNKVTYPGLEAAP